MTLNVTAYRTIRDADGERLEEIDCPSDLAGFESTRSTFYAGPLARRLGLKLLPQLATANLTVWGEDLAALRLEVLLLLEHLGPEDDYWRFRLGNILQAVGAAEAFGDDGMVTIE